MTLADFPRPIQHAMCIFSVFRHLGFTPDELFVELVPAPTPQGCLGQVQIRQDGRGAFLAFGLEELSVEDFKVNLLRACEVEMDQPQNDAFVAASQVFQLLPAIVPMLLRGGLVVRNTSAAALATGFIGKLAYA